MNRSKIIVLYRVGGYKTISQKWSETKQHPSTAAREAA